MRGLDLTGVGGLLLLVLPVLSIVCVLLTGPVALIIGRRQGEEEQVARAPLLVAGIAVFLEAALAIVLLRQSGVRQALPLPLGNVFFLLDRYTVGSVFALSIGTLIFLAAMELSRSTPGVLTTGEIAAVLFAWGAQVFLGLSGGIPTAVIAICLSNVSISTLLLVEAWRQPPSARLWLASWAVVVPLVALVLLLPFRGLRIGSDMLDARTILRISDPAFAHSLLARLWLAGGLSAALGIVAFAGVRKPRIIASPAPPIFASMALLGILPALFRITATGFPAGSPIRSHFWLSPRAAAASVAVGVIALVIAQAKLSPFRRVCLLSVGCLCALAWVMTVFRGGCGTVALVQATIAGLTLPLCFSAVAALEGARTSPPTSPAWLPLTGAALLPICAGVAWAWPWAAAHRGTGGSVVAGLLLAGLLLAAGIRLGVQLARGRRAAMARGFFPASSGHAQRSPLLGECAFLFPWWALIAIVAVSWAAGIHALSPPLP